MRCDHWSTAWTEAKSMLIMTNVAGDDDDDDDDDDAVAPRLKAALLKDIAVAEGLCAMQCSILTKTSNL